MKRTPKGIQKFNSIVAMMTRWVYLRSGCILIACLPFKWILGYVHSIHNRAKCLPIHHARLYSRALFLSSTRAIPNLLSPLWLMQKQVRVKRQQWFAWMLIEPFFFKCRFKKSDMTLSQYKMKCKTTCDSTPWWSFRLLGRASFHLQCSCSAYHTTCSKE